MFLFIIVIYIIFNVLSYCIKLNLSISILLNLLSVDSFIISYSILFFWPAHIDEAIWSILNTIFFLSTIVSYFYSVLFYKINHNTCQILLWRNLIYIIYIIYTRFHYLILSIDFITLSRVQCFNFDYIYYLSTISHSFIF